MAMRNVRIRRVGTLLSLAPILLGALMGCAGSGGSNVDSPGSSAGSVPPSTAPTATVTTAAVTTATVAASAPPTTGLPSSTVPAAFDPYVNAAPATAAVGEVDDEWVETPDGRQRHYRLYVPTTIRAGQAAPLLIALHGGLGSSEQFAVNSGFDELAESNGFIVVYPDGIRAIPDRPGLQTWNGGYCCGPAVRQNVDDVGFIRMLINLLEARFDIDANRVFATGHSNGAIMSYRLACELSDRIVAIGVQAGNLGIDDCQPAEPVSLLHIHGLADTNQPIDGGMGTGVSGVEARSGREAARALAALNGCTEGPAVEVIASNTDVEVSTWSGCDSGAVARLMTVAGATHAWMGHASAADGAAALVGKPYMNLDASRAIWSFLAEHPRR